MASSSAKTQTQQLLRAATNPYRFRSLFQSASASAIRAASSPHEALSLYKTRSQWRRLERHDAYTFDTHAAVFAIKAACSHTSHALIVPHLHSHLLKTSIHTDVYVATSLLHGYALSSLRDACALFDEMPHRNIVTSNTMISCYLRYGDVDGARSMFNDMPERDIATWSAVIGGYMDRGSRALGLELFREMMRDGGQMRPDQLMLVTMISGCAGTGSLQLVGKSIHAYAEKNGLEINMQLGTSLIDMYMKTGCLMSAFRVFGRMPEKNVMHWTAMITGLALHGHGEDALAFFEEMRKVGVKPNEITFTGVLNACCHVGLIEEGQRYFSSMAGEFGFEPGIHHYGCMVDLFSKEGRLEDAHRMIESMKVEPNIIILTSFLASCKKHKNFEMAERVLDKVLSMVNPDEDGGVYTLISDLYALGGKWNDVERVRKMMDQRNVKKNRGSSFI